MPRDIATREIFNVCTAEGLSVEQDRLAVYLDLTHIPRATLDHKLGGILEIYEKFQGVDPREVPMKIFPRRPLFDGRPVGRLRTHSRRADWSSARSRNQQTNIPGLYAIGECDYQYHGANRLGANSLLSCIFSGLVVAPASQTSIKATQKRPGSRRPRCIETARKHHQACTIALLQAGGRRRKSLSAPPGTGPGDDQGRPPSCAQNGHLAEPTGGVGAGRSGPGDVRFPTPGNGPIKTWCSPNRSSICFRWPRRFSKGAGPRRMPRRALQARLCHARRRGGTIRPSSGVRPRPGATVSRRTPAVGSNRPSPSCRPTASRNLSYEDVNTSLIPPRPAACMGWSEREVIEEVWNSAARSAPRRWQLRRAIGPAAMRVATIRSTGRTAIRRAGSQECRQRPAAAH